MESGWLISNNYNIKFLILNIDNSKLYTGISNFDNLFQGNGTFFLSSQRHEGTTIFEEYLQRAQCGSWYRRIYNPWSWLLGKMGKGWGAVVECYTDCEVSTWINFYFTGQKFQIRRQTWTLFLFVNFILQMMQRGITFCILTKIFNI